MCKNAIQFVSDISLISSFFYISIYLSIATQPSLCWTCEKSAKEGFLMMRLICQRLYNALLIFDLKTTGHNLQNLLLLYKK